MAVDIGSEAIDRPGSFSRLYTAILLDNPASIAGLVTSVDIWAYTDVTGLRVGTFYTINESSFRCRDSEAIPGTITAGSKVTKIISVAVEIGDYIGAYWADGEIERHTSGYAGIYYNSGEHIDPGDEATYTLLPGDTLSIGGYIEEVPVGWTGKISGVTNPAKIMGVDVANIAKVKGVVSA